MGLPSAFHHEYTTIKYPENVFELLGKSERDEVES